MVMAAKTVPAHFRWGNRVKIGGDSGARMAGQAVLGPFQMVLVGKAQMRGRWAMGPLARSFHIAMTERTLFVVGHFFVTFLTRLHRRAMPCSKSLRASDPFMAGEAFYFLVDVLGMGENELIGAGRAGGARGASRAMVQGGAGPEKSHGQHQYPVHQLHFPSPRLAATVTRAKMRKS